MAHEVQDMDKSTILNRLNPAKHEHLKPLSIYSRMITCDQKDSLHQIKFTNPFINFKIEVVNNCAGKRKLDDTSRDDGYETPAKKAFSPKALSPDLGCFMDYCSPPEWQDAMSPFAISKPTLLDETQASRSEHVECGSSTEPGGSEGTVPHSLTCEKMLLSVAPAFDCDVEDILCLNPIGTAGGFSDHVEGCNCPSSNTSQNKPVLIPTVAHVQELKRGDGKVEEGGEELKKELHLNVDVEEDKGYFSMSYINDLKLGKDPSHPQLYPATSSPLLRIGEDEFPNPESPSEPGGRKQAALSGQHVSFTVSDLCPVVSEPLSESLNSALEDDIEELFNIGQPIFESSVCHSVTVKLNGSEQSRQVSEEVQEGIIEPILECRATLRGEETTLDTSYETTLPLQVQVKSVVVAPGQHTSKTAAPPLPERNLGARTQRLVVFDKKGDWEREKRLYINSVTRHMNEKQGTVQDAMSELMNLMTHVAEQTPGIGGSQWQHPSDLTRRNYQTRCGNMTPTVALKEWQAKNSTTHKRFAKVPKIFERSQFR